MTKQTGGIISIKQLFKTKHCFRHESNQNIPQLLPKVQHSAKTQSHLHRKCGV